MTILLVLSVSPFTFAETTDTQRVFDNDSRYSETELEELEASIAEIQAKFDIDIVVVNHKDFDGKTPSAFGNDFYTDNSFSKDGIIFAYSFDLGRIYLAAKGKCNDILSTADLEEIKNIIVANLRTNPNTATKDFLESVRQLWIKNTGIDDTEPVSSESTSSESPSSESPSSEPIENDNLISEETEKVQHAFDYTNSFSEREFNAINTQATEISKDLSTDIVLVSHTDFDGKSARDFAADFYDYGGYSKDGIILAYSLELGEITVVASGKCIEIFNQDALDYIRDKSGKSLRDYQYVGAMDFIQTVDLFLREYIKDGYLSSDLYAYASVVPDSYESENEPTGFFRNFTAKTIVLVILIPLIIAFIICYMVYRKYTLAGSQYHYPLSERGSINLTRNEDIFIREHTTVVDIPKNNSSSSSGGGSSFTGSSGTNHSSSSGKF